MFNSFYNSMTITKKEHEAFLKAVDLVCINCVCLNEQTCENCPVRKTVDYFRTKKD